MPIDLETTNVWLRVLAICAVVQVLALAVAVVYVARLVTGINHSLNKATIAIEQLEETTAPLVEHVKTTLSGINDVTTRIRKAGDATETAVSHLKDAARAKLWPVIVAGRVAGAIISKLSGRRRSAASH